MLRIQTEKRRTGDLLDVDTWSLYFLGSHGHPICIGKRDKSHSKNIALEKGRKGFARKKLRSTRKSGGTGKSRRGREMHGAQTARRKADRGGRKKKKKQTVGALGTKGEGLHEESLRQSRRHRLYFQIPERQ